MQGFTHAEEADRAYKVKEIPEDIDGDVDLRINIYWREGNVKLFFCCKNANAGGTDGADYEDI